MTEQEHEQSHDHAHDHAHAPIPDDDPSRRATTARPDDADLPHVAVVGDTYTIVVAGKDTDGRYCYIDMLVPPGGGPPPHRHDFEEMFTVVEGEVEVTFRGEKSIATVGTTINVPANSPHSFTNASDQNARLYCTCAPAGQDDFFLEVGTKVPTRTSPAPAMDDEAQAAFRAKSQALAAHYKTELLGP